MFGSWASLVAQIARPPRPPLGWEVGCAAASLRSLDVLTKKGAYVVAPVAHSCCAARLLASPLTPSEEGDAPCVAMRWKPGEARQGPVRPRPPHPGDMTDDPGDTPGAFVPGPGGLAGIPKLGPARH